MQEISEMAAMARSILHKQVRQTSASPTQPSQPTVANNSKHISTVNSQHVGTDNSELSITTKAANSFDNSRQSPLGIVLKSLTNLYNFL